MSPKVITASNSKSSFKAHTSMVVLSVSEETNTAVLSQAAGPNWNRLTGSSEVLVSLPILLSGAGRWPLHIRPTMAQATSGRLRDRCKESRHCQGITNTISSSNIQRNTELWAIREWNVCKYVSCVEIKRLWWKQNKVQRCCPVEQLSQGGRKKQTC